LFCYLISFLLSNLYPNPGNDIGTSGGMCSKEDAVLYTCTRLFGKLVGKKDGTVQQMPKFNVSISMETIQKII